MDKQTLFVILVHYEVDLEKIESALKEHRSFLQKGYDSGLLLASGPRNPRDGGVIIGKFSSKQEAENFTKNDPFFKHHFAKYEIFEFSAVLHHKLLDTFLQ